MREKLFFIFLLFVSQTLLMAKISEKELSLKYKKPKKGDFIILETKKTRKNDFIILDDMQHNNTQQKFSKRKKHKTLLKYKSKQKHFIAKKRKKYTKNKISFLKNIKKDTRLKTSINPYKNLSIRDLIKIYKKRVSSNQNIDEKLFITLRKKILQNSSQMYDKLAIINALWDIQNKNVDKYEALLIVNTMLKEIK